MSGYAHQLEREISFLSQTTPSARTSELGSHYERGFSISGLSATVLIGALVVAGVSLIALLTALAIMLQSCQSKSAGIIDLSDYKSPEDNMCKILAMHAELNELSTDEIPLKCKEDATRYIRSAQYERDLEFVIGLVIGYFSSLKPQADGLDIILLDADDLFSPIPHGKSIIQSSFIVKADTLKHILMLGLYKTLPPRLDAGKSRGKKILRESLMKKKIISFIKLSLKIFFPLLFPASKRSVQVQGWQLVLVSRKPIEDRNATVNYLVSSGYTDWLSLIMRSEMPSSGYISRQRAKLEEEGKRIVGIVSSKMDALSVAFSRTRMFKLPSHVYFHY